MDFGELIAIILPSLAAAAADKKAEESDKCEYWPKTYTVDYSGSLSKHNSSTQISAWNIAFRLEVNAKMRRCRVISIFKWGAVAGDVTNKQKRRTKRKFKAMVRRWSNRYKLKVVDPDCGTKTMRMKFKLLWSPDDTSDTATHKVNLIKNEPRAYVSGLNVHIGYNDVRDDGAWTLAHEYGHTVGLQDEYFYDAVTSATVTYKKADGSSEAVTLEPPNRNIMRTYANRRYRKRFFYYVAIEAQELLRKEAGRNNITCEIV